MAPLKKGLGAIEANLSSDLQPLIGSCRAENISFMGSHREAGLPPRIGYGVSIGQHGELFQGQIRDGNAQLRRCLVSLPCDGLFSKVTFIPNASQELRVEPSHKWKVKRIVELTLAHFPDVRVGGLVRVESNIREGKGYGSSTADCVAGAIAAARAMGLKISEDEVARIVVRAEVASDSIMFRRAVLFAHREGAVLEDYGSSIPKLEVLGIDTNEDSCVVTLDYPPAVYRRSQIEAFQTLASALRRAIRHGDVQLLACVSSASAIINEEFLPKPMFKEIQTLTQHAGVLGVGVAHSGTVLSILLDPKDPLLEHRVDGLRTELAKIGISQVLRFHT
jgi:uncharacterized protein involved in propanediol utilization